MTTEEKLDRLTAIVESLASSVVHHDNQIEALIKVGERHDAELQALLRQWQAYINTLRQQ